MNSMGLLYNDSSWGIALFVVFLLLFAFVGVAHIINPDYFIKRSGVIKGGEMLTGWNRFGFRYGGAAFAGASIYMLYVLLRSVLAK